MEEEYEILSHEEIEQLKKDALKYKNNPFTKDNSQDKLYNSILELTRSIAKLTKIFEDVKEQIIQEHEQGEGPDKKLDKLLEQNKHIAKALVSFGEKVEGLTTNEPKNILSNASENEQNLPQQNQENNNKNQENNNQKQQSIDIDYQAWNYGKPSKPGVSQSGMETQEVQQESGYRYPVFDSPPQNQFSRESQPPNYQKEQSINNNIGFISPPNSQEFKNQPIPIFNNNSLPNQEFEKGFQNQRIYQNEINNQYNQQSDYSNPNQKDMPELKPITKEKPRNKKKFGLF